MLNRCIAAFPLDRQRGGKIKTGGAVLCGIFLEKAIHWRDIEVVVSFWEKWDSY